MACLEELDAMLEARWNYSMADEDFLNAALVHGSVSLGIAVGGTKLAWDVIMRKFSPIALAAEVGLFVGGLIGGAASLHNLGNAKTKQIHAKSLYYRAKEKYDECMLSALPEDTG